MNLLDILISTNNYLGYVSLPVFALASVFFTLKTNFIQIRAIPRFFKIAKNSSNSDGSNKTNNTVNPFHALFTAMSTTIGMGNIVGPSLAIAAGGPGALFWLIVYIFFGAATKFVEVTLSVYCRSVSKNGLVIGGPSQYLKLASYLMSNWYCILTIFLFTGWSVLQVNTVKNIWGCEGVPSWIMPLICIIGVLAVNFGSVKRLGFITSRLVPLKFTLYIIFVLGILLRDIPAIFSAIKLVIASAFSGTSAIGGFAGATVFMAFREGFYKGIFITESGLGTVSIAHALSDIKKPSDQGVLAAVSVVADMLLCSISGLLTIVTGVWMQGGLSNTLIYKAFAMHAPSIGKYILLISVLIFVVTAIIGNTYNGSQSFAAYLGIKRTWIYIVFSCVAMFFGSYINTLVLWHIMDFILVLVGIPHIFSLFYIAFKYQHIFKLEK